MECEICGRYIERGKRIKVENSIVTACEECSKYGEVVAEVRLKVKKEGIIQQKPAPVFDTGLESDSRGGELMEDYHLLIRESREKLGLKQEELAKAINEPVSLIHRIESGRIKQGIEITKKIEKILKVRLLEIGGDIEAGRIKTDSKELTLGDMVIVKKRKQ